MATDDIISFDTLNRSDDEIGILRSRSYVQSLISEQIKDGIPARRIILGGFSQGGAVSLFSGLTFTERLGGVFGLSCYQLADAKFNSLREETGNKRPPVFMGHGQIDPLVRCAWGKQTAEGLRKKGFEVNWNEYPGLEHSAAPEEIDQLGSWIEARLADEPQPSSM